MMRLDKMLAHTGYGSRKEVKEYIRKGLVSVNGVIITDDDYKVDESSDEVIIADNNVEYEKMIYLMLNKPDGYISATYDPADPIVLDLIDGYEKRNLFPVGRLDKDTEGLLLITNDGVLAHNLLSPKKHVDKIYELEYEGTITDSGIKAFEKGITLDDGFSCAPGKLEKLDTNKARVTIHEGKFHQVKRMMASINCNVTYLKRVEFGPLKLDETLKLGQYRPLTEEELKTLKGE